jgi:hypothetical protein
MTPNYYDRLLAAWERGQAPGREEGRGRLAELTTRVWPSPSSSTTQPLPQGVHLEVPRAERLVKPPLPTYPAPSKKTIVVPKIFSR